MSERGLAFQDEFFAKSAVVAGVSASPPRFDPIPDNIAWSTAIQWVDEQSRVIIGNAHRYVMHTSMEDADVLQEARILAFSLLTRNFTGEIDRFTGYFYTAFRNRMIDLSTNVPIAHDVDVESISVQPEQGAYTSRSLEEERSLFRAALRRLTKSQQRFMCAVVDPRSVTLRSGSKLPMNRSDYTHRITRITSRILKEVSV